MDEIMVCEFCGGTEWEYLGESYDDDVHMGGSYECIECGHQQTDETESLEDPDFPSVY